MYLDLNMRESRFASFGIMEYQQIMARALRLEQLSILSLSSGIYKGALKDLQSFVCITTLKQASDHTFSNEVRPVSTERFRLGNHGSEDGLIYFLIFYTTFRSQIGQSIMHYATMTVSSFSPRAAAYSGVSIPQAV